MSYCVPFLEYEVFFLVFFLFCSFYFCTFFLICCFSVLSSSRRSWTLPRAVSHSHSVRTDWPNFLEKVFSFVLSFVSNSLSFLCRNIWQTSVSVAASPNENRSAEDSRVAICPNPIGRQQRRYRTILQNPALCSVMLFYIQCQRFYNSRFLR